MLIKLILCGVDMPFKVDENVEDAVFQDMGIPSKSDLKKMGDKGTLSSIFEEKSRPSAMARMGHFVFRFVRGVGEEMFPSVSTRAREKGRQPGILSSIMDKKTP